MVERVIAECRSYSPQADTHRHDYAQLILPLHGSLMVATPTQAVAVDSSLLFFVPPWCEHTFHAHAPNEFLVLDIPLPWVSVGRDRSTSASGGVLQPLTDQWLALRHLLLSEAQRPDPALADLTRYACQMLRSPTTPRSIAYLQAHYHEAILVEQLAALEGYTAAYYSEWFKARMGMTPKQYLHQLRIQHAKVLLQDTDLPLAEIALLVGYEHHASLTRLFKQQEGRSPQQYRQCAPSRKI
jgi:AraC-like DNA-binding protein